MRKGINKLKCGAFLSERYSQFVVLYKILRIPSIDSGDTVRVKKFYQYYDTSRVDTGSSFKSTSTFFSTTIKISHVNEIFKHKILNYSFLKI